MELLAQKNLVEQYLGQVPRSLSTHSFANIFAWQDFCQYDIRLIRGCLCLFARDSAGTFLYLPPLGSHVGQETIDDCFDIMRSQNGHHRKVARIENVAQGMLSLFDADKYERYKKGYEYCYWRRDVAGLKGNAYKTRRWSYNHFISHYDHRYCSFSPGMVDGCMSLYRLWQGQQSQKEKDPVARQMLAENGTVHRLIITHHRTLGLTGRVVLVDGVIKAYTFGYALNEKMFCVLSEITDLNIKGLSAYIFREFCADEALCDFDFINVMDDMALPRLGHSKMLYRPSMMLPAHVITEK